MGTRLLYDIYQRCKTAVCKPTNNKTKTDQNWIAAMELFIIGKNKTGELVSRPENKKVTRVKWEYRIKLNVYCSTNNIKLGSWSRDMLKYLVWTTQTPSHQFLDSTSSSSYSLLQHKRTGRFSS